MSVIRWLDILNEKKPVDAACSVVFDSIVDDFQSNAKAGDILEPFETRIMSFNVTGPQSWQAVVRTSLDDDMYYEVSYSGASGYYYLFSYRNTGQKIYRA